MIAHGQEHPASRRNLLGSRQPCIEAGWCPDPPQASNGWRIIVSAGACDLAPHHSAMGRTNPVRIKRMASAAFRFIQNLASDRASSRRRGRDAQKRRRARSYNCQWDPGHSHTRAVHLPVQPNRKAAFDTLPPIALFRSAQWTASSAPSWLNKRASLESRNAATCPT